MEEKYFRDKDGQLKPDRRNENQQLMFTLAKINTQQEEVERQIRQQEKIIEGRMSMFETLLRERLDHTCDEIESVKVENDASNAQLKERFEYMAGGFISQQKERDKLQDEKIQMVETRIRDHEIRITELEKLPTSKKAKNYDKILAGVLGVGATLLLTRLSGWMEAFLLFIEK